MFKAVIFTISFIITANFASADVGSVTGFEIPRFASLKSNKVNVRTGPGKRYPIDWVFTRKHMPVKIIAEYDNWRKIRDWEGYEGWVHQSLISGRRSVMIKGQEGFILRREANYTAAPVVKVMPSVAVYLEQCKEGWCEVDAEGYSGWINYEYLWGLNANEHL